MGANLSVLLYHCTALHNDEAAIIFHISFDDSLFFVGEVIVAV
jgi:hypothetical protein